MSTSTNLKHIAASVHAHLASILLHLAKEHSFWVKSAAQCAAGPLICAMLPARNSGRADSLLPPDIASEGEDEIKDAVVASASIEQAFPCLLALYRDAVLSPRPPAQEVLMDLAQCFAGVTVRLVPRLVSWETSGLAGVFQ
jgi:hypothetical protein